MSDKLSFNEEKLFSFLFSKIIELQADVFSQKTLLKALHNHLHPDDAVVFDKMQQALKEQKAKIVQDHAETFVAELKSISDDFDSMLGSLINPK